MIKDTPINSDSYWDERFSDDWETLEGPQQSRFFARLAIQNLPSWLLEQIKREGLTCVDWGCAQGDGTDVLSGYIDAGQLMGVDFSAIAVDQAAKRYPAIFFSHADWLVADDEHYELYDIVFSSNTLEHFHKPYQVLNVLAGRAKRAVVLALPYREHERIPEHFYSFLPENVPLVLSNGFRLVWSRVVDCSRLEDTHWAGDQIILVYADTAWSDSLRLALSDAHIEQIDTVSEIASLTQMVAERDGQIASLTQAVAERDGQVAGLSQAVAERDGQVAGLIQAVAERDGQVAGLIQAVAERDAQIASLTQAVAERDGQVASLSQAVAERDGEVAGLTEALAERDGQLASLTQTVAEREGQVAGLTQAVVERDGQLASLNQTLAEREERITNLNREITIHDEQIKFVNSELLRIKHSTSWTITRPIRFAKQFARSPARAIYNLAKFTFWRLPYSLRQALHNPRHKFVRLVRQSPSVKNRATTSDKTGDLTWYQFSSQILSRRHEYKGVFVQELVIDWNVPLYQRPQHIAVALGRLGYLVIYRTDNWAGDNVEGFREVSESVWITNRHEVDELDEVVRSFYSTAYANTPEIIMNNGKRGVLVYEYIDHIDPEISGDEGNIKRLLALKDFAFGGGADFVVASARKLYDEAAEMVGKERVILVQNGVDTRHYRNPAHLNTEVPDTLQAFRVRYKTLVGYFGALAPWLWYEAISELVSQRPDLGFVFIGPDYYGGAQQLPSAKNVLYLGTVDYSILPAYALRFDVCFIPFKPGEIAKTTSPLKLFEYFALEKPVVVTSEMLECIHYPEVFSGDSADSLSIAIDRAIAVKDKKDFKNRMAQLADDNDWDQRARAMAVCFGESK